MSDLLSELQSILVGGVGGRFDGVGSSSFGRVLDYFGGRGKGVDGVKGRNFEVYGNWGSLGRLLGAFLHRELNRPVLYVTGHVPEGDRAQDDLETFAGKGVLLFPAAETHEVEPEPTSEIACERLRLCQLSGGEDLDCPLMATSISALMQPVPSMDFLEEQSLELVLGQDLAAEMGGGGGSVAVLCEWLVEHEFGRVDQVEVVGEFAGRGGIVDIFSPGQDQPVRVEFFGDEIESLRFFDLDTQRSTDAAKGIKIVGCKSYGNRGGGETGATVSFLHYLKPDTLLVLEESGEIAELGRLFRERLSAPEAVFEAESILQEMSGFDTLYINRFLSDAGSEAINLESQSVQRFEKLGGRALVQGDDRSENLIEAAQDNQVYFFCENQGQKQRVEEIIASGSESGTEERKPEGKRVKKTKAPRNLHLPLGFIHRGFALPGRGLILLSHHEVFGQHQPKRRIRRVKNIQAIESFTDLDKNDLVVHVNYGIGRFKGMKTLEKNGRKQEFIALQYAGGALVHVPADKIYLIHKYVGCKVGRPRLAKLGSKTWDKQKRKVSDAVEDLAVDLVELQAYREAVSGIAYAPDTTWQRELEESFPYEDTDDQVSTNEDIKRDMEHSSPMDRLLCGDVGYGKTELAIRATFKAAEFGKQTAVLVPTTVLAGQHYRTFSERLADFPVEVAVLSRFQTPRQARAIIKKLKEGRIDILVGTHRILSGDIHFKDLGLIVIDEEQRFGVEHKERLKKMRKTVDILTMTATPIPRTLHMALLGIRDISSLTTPPLDRRSIVTEVCAYDEGRIRDAILRELNREGQVYFVHNRVQSVNKMADTIRELVPEARVIVAHGQMPKHELESRMLEFVNYQADILVCTTIIESGLDIPNVNTIFINDADRFGLAELHQLRGRVGRQKNRAYAYMLLPRRRTINPTAVKRLKAIEEYSQLGSGFRIALRDLEIRGAGNILGVEQSGHIDAVGYEFYCQLLGAAVRRIKGEPEPLQATCHLELNLDCHIPSVYISSDRQRMDVYRRLAGCSSSADLEQLENDLHDLFGKPPQTVDYMLQMAEIRMMAGRWSVRSIVEKKPDIIFSVDKMQTGAALFSSKTGRFSMPDEHTIYLRLPETYFENPVTILALLRKMLGERSNQ